MAAGFNAITDDGYDISCGVGLGKRAKERRPFNGVVRSFTAFDTPFI